MEDRLRFKIWDKKRKSFYPVGVIDMITNDDGYLVIDCSETNNLDIVQCTGLKDVDGTFIYEGDVIDIEGARGMVSWLDDGWVLIGEGFDGDHLFAQTRSVSGFNDGKAMWGKIVGNKYENDINEVMKYGKD